jgi:RNA polymerase sigma-70 factor (ECF subfamily)
MYMKNKADTEDMTQNTFLRLTSSGKVFDTPEHARAWLIRTAINICKNSLKSIWSKRITFDEWADGSDFKCESVDYSTRYGTIPEPDETLMKIMKLPPQLKTALYLYYYESYTTPEIAKMMNKPESTVRGYLHRGRETLKKEIESERSGSQLNSNQFGTNQFGTTQSGIKAIV